MKANLAAGGIAAMKLNVMWAVFVNAYHTSQ